MNSADTPRVAALDTILAQAPVVPVIAIKRFVDAVPLAEALVAGRLPALELTLRTSVALAAIERVEAAVPGAVVGAGTVRSSDDLAAVHRAGAAFAISPGSAPPAASTRPRRRRDPAARHSSRRAESDVHRRARR